MQIKQDPITKLWCREDGAVLVPPSRKFLRFRWTFGSSDRHGYRTVRYRGKLHRVHRLVCRAFHGLPPEGKPEVDHISRVPSANFASNLRWIDRKGNEANKDRVDLSVEKYGVRACEDKHAYASAYMKPYNAAKCAGMKAQGLVYRKGPDGKKGWFPRVRPVKEVAPCI